MSAKLHRWVDLMAALLSHRGTQTFEDLARQVPDYADGSQGAVKRMFERDKDELRALGVPIETIGKDGDEDMAYRLRTNNFYLPYLCVISDDGDASTPHKVDRWGYHGLPQLTFESDELDAIVRAADRIRQLGDSGLAADVDSAIRKLAFDLPLDVARQPGDERIKADRNESPDILRILSAALVAHKRVSIDYHSMSSGTDSTREVEPYGIFFVDAHWYLAAREIELEAIRNFRVSRIRAARANTSKPGTPDFHLPAGFNLSEHARARRSWEIGSDDEIEATVEIRGGSGPAIAAANLGKELDESLRRFKVRRPEVFARWLMSFGGELVPVEPPAVVEEYQRQVRKTRELYA